MLENESRANENLSRYYPHDLQVSPGICNTLPLGTSNSTMQQPFHVPNPTPFMGVVSNKLIRNGGGIAHAVVGSSEETVSPSQLYGRTDWSHPHQPGTALAPTHYAGTTFSTRPSIPTMPCGPISSFAATIPPSIAWSPNRSDHGVVPSNSQRGTIQELNPCAEYVAPSKGPMTGGVEVTIVGTNFPHTLPLSVYFSKKPALIVSGKHLARDQPINVYRLPDSKDSGDHTMFGSRRIISWTCRSVDCGGTPRIGTGD